MFVFGFCWLFLCCSTVIFVIPVYPKIMSTTFFFSFFGCPPIHWCGFDKRRKFVNYFDQACVIWKACCIMRRQNECGGPLHTSLWIRVWVLCVKVAFRTGDYKQQVIFIGGLTDGFFATEWVDVHHIIPSKGEYTSNGRCWSDRHHF